MKGGVIVCNAEQQITLYNLAAEDLLDRSDALKPGGLIYTLFPSGPIEHALDLLRYRQSKENSTAPGQQYIQFMNSTCDHSRFFQCRLCLMQDSADAEQFTVVIFEDAGSWYAPGNRLYLKTEEIRAPIANLRAAVENITEHPDMPPVMRSAFENVLVQESLNLSNTFNSLAETCHGLLQSQSPLIEMKTSLFFGYLQEFLEKGGVGVTKNQDCPHVIRTDTYGLILVVDFMINKLQKGGKGDALICETFCGGQFAYIDLLWPGETIATADIETWLAEVLEESVGNVTVSEILKGQGGDIWSQPHSNPGFSILRLAMPVEI
jgi:hypothetical protein